MAHPREPRIARADAEALCAEPYFSLSDALAVARRLRAAGWVVVEHGGRPYQRPDGTSMVASVYHPVSYESPGDLLTAGAAAARHAPAGDADPPARTR